MIVSAALKVKFKDLPYDVIVPCIRHSFGYQIIRDCGNKEYEYIQEGFVDNHNSFFNRKEALEYCSEIGQVNATIRNEYSKEQKKELYSEDLY